MAKIKRWAIPALWGIGYALLVILLSRVLLRSLGSLLLIAGVEGQAVQAVQQLKQARLASPWLLPAGIVALTTVLGGLLQKPKPRRWIGIGGAVLLLLPCVGLAFCFTRVNSICVLDLLRSVLPLLL